MTTPVPPSTVVFDLGGVLLHWDPHRAFHEVLEPDDIQPFLDEINFEEWNHQHDAGARFVDGVAALTERFPHHAAAIEAYPRNHALTVTGQIDGTVAIVDDLERAGVRLLALTNWSAETFPWARSTFSVLQRFEGIVVSGEEGVAKPDPRLFRVLIERYGLTPSDTVFVDDRQVNVDAARELGLVGLLFVEPDRLRDDLRGLGLLGAGD
jgi:2-haloacid dehalogenase